MSCPGGKVYWRKMFTTLNEKLEKIVGSIRGKAIISEDDLDFTLREIRVAFLEADVALSVVKSFIENIKLNIIGQEVLKSIKPDQMIIKLVQGELIKILGSGNEPLNIMKNGSVDDAMDEIKSEYEKVLNHLKDDRKFIRKAGL